MIAHMRLEFPNTDKPALELEDEACLPDYLDPDNSPILFGCRSGVCGTCLVEVEPATPASSDGCTPPAPEESELLAIIAEGRPHARLACQMRCKGTIRIKYIGAE